MNRPTTAAVFGAVLRELRIQRALSQEKLALEAGLNRTYISLLELGQRLPSLDTMLALSRALQVPLSGLASIVQDRLEAQPQQDGPQTDLTEQAKE